MSHREIAFRIAFVALGIALPVALFEGIGAAIVHWDKANYAAVMPDEVRRVINRKDRHIATSPDPYLGYRIAPNIARERVQTNAHGLRAGPIGKRPDADVLRILFLGGSVAWGYNSNSNDDTIATYLQEALTRRAPAVPALQNLRIEVLNAGTPAYVVWQGALAYAIRLRELGAAWVFSLDATNDITSAIENGVAGVPMRYRLTRDAYHATEPDLLTTLGAWLMQRVRDSKAARAVDRLNPKSTSDFGAPPPNEVAREFAAAARFLADTAEQEYARVLHVLQPMAILPKTKPLTEFERQMIIEFEHRMPGRNAYFNDSYTAMRAALAQVDRERGDVYRWIDATAAFADVTDPTYTDDCHLTPLGRRRLAEAWIAALDETTTMKAREST